MKVGDLVIPNLVEIMKQNDGQFDLAYQGEDYAIFWLLHMVPLKIARMGDASDSWTIYTEGEHPFLNGYFMWDPMELKPYSEQELIGNRVIARLYGLMYDHEEIGDNIPDEAS